MADSAGRTPGAAGAPAPRLPFVRRWIRPSVAARLLIGVGVIALALWYGNERILHRVSLEGVVNSPVLVLRSPIDGRVIKSLATPGLALTQTTDLVDIENPRIKAQIEALDRRIAQLTQMHDELTKRVEEHRAATVEHWQRSIREMEAMLQSSQSVLARAQSDDKRAQELAQETLVGRQRVDETHDGRLRAEADVSRIGAMLDRTRGDLTAAERGIVVGEGYGDVPYSQQRIDEIRLTLAELAQQRVVLVQAMTASISVPPGAVIRTVNVREGSDVQRDAPLAEIVDCSRAYIEAALPERGFDQVQPGSAATVTLRGNSAELHATVRTLQGSGSAQEPAMAEAAVLERPSSDSMTVLLDVNPAELRGFSDGRCQVGREATVVFAK